MGDKVTEEKVAGEHEIYGVKVKVLELTWRDAKGLSFDVTTKTAAGEDILTMDESFDEYPDDERLTELVGEWLGKQRPLIDAMVQAALLRTQHLKEERDKIFGHLQHLGRGPARSKRATTAEAAYTGALTILASVLAEAGIGDVIRLDLPSLEEAERYLGEWDAERTRKALNRAVDG